MKRTTIVSCNWTVVNFTILVIAMTILCRAKSFASEIERVVVQPNPVVYSGPSPPAVLIAVELRRTGPLDVSDCNVIIDPGDRTNLKKLVINVFVETQPVIHNYSGAGTYTLVVRGEGGCSGQKSVAVKVQKVTNTQVDPIVVPTQDWSNGVDTAINWTAGGKIYFFKGSQYTRLTDTQVDNGYPRLLPGGWIGLPESWTTGIEASFYHPPSNKSYMFKGNQYLRLTGTQVDAGYPKKLPGDWMGIPPSWLVGIDAVLYHEPTQKTYMFKGTDYIRLTNMRIDPGYPQTLPGGWKGLPASFSEGIDAAVFRAGYTYFFKGNQYVRFTGTTLDPDYPRPLPGGWKFQP